MRKPLPTNIAVHQDLAPQFSLRNFFATYLQIDQSIDEIVEEPRVKVAGGS